MEAMGTISAGAIVVKKYQASSTLSLAGICLQGAGAANTDIGAVIPVTQSTALTTAMVGLTLDTTGTVGSTGVTDTNDILVSVAVNPDLIIKAKMAASATSDVALAVQNPSGDDSTGADTAITNLDEGFIWGYSGANKGIMRRATDTTGGAAINFENGILTTDEYCFAAGGMPGACTAAALFSPDLTSTFDQVDAQTTGPGDNDYFQTFDVILGTEDDDGINNSFYLFVQNKSCFGNSGTSG
jgi:hypothetical protein